MATMESGREKRAAVTETVTEDAEPQPKKLRLRIREPSAQACVQDALKAETEDAAVTALLELREEFLPSLNSSLVLPLALDILALMKAKNHEHVLETAAELFKEAVAGGVREMGEGEVGALCEAVVSSVVGAGVESPLLPHLIPLLNLLGQGRDLRQPPFSLVPAEAERAAHSKRWDTRRQALGCLSLWCGGGGAEVGGVVGLGTRLGRDADPRVRAEALAALLVLSHRGPLPLHTYHILPLKLLDEEEEVRLSALPLLHHFAIHYPNERVGEDEGRRLVDDAFSHLCNSMNDSSLTVRIAAASLLGQIEGVGVSFLEQTLDKKLMTSMRRTRQSRFGIGANARNSEWSTGRRLGHDAPVEKAEEDSASLIPSGACGAFVTGLEDEYMGVREACVRSLSRLAARVPSLASKALDFLADMFNDEIAEVRLEAMESLGPLIRMGTLSEDQMEVILGVLDDVSAESRAALRDLLAQAALPTITALHTTLTALLANLHKYPGDRESIWRALAGLGQRHPSFLLALAPKLLGLHPYFDIAEPPIDDPTYVAKLILVLNAAKDNGPLMGLFPPHLWRHHLFLRHAHPHLVPALHPNALRPPEEKKAEGEVEEESIGVLALLSLHRRLLLAQKIGGGEEEGRLGSLAKEASALRELGDAASPGASLLHCLANLKLRLRALERMPAWDRQESPQHWNQAWNLLTELEGEYGGGGRGLGLLVAKVRLRLSLLALALSHKASAHNFPLPILFANINSLQENSESQSADLEYCAKISAALEPLIKRKPGSRLVISEGVRADVLALLLASPVTWPEDLDLAQIHILTGRLWRESEGTLKLTAGLAVSTEMAAEVFGLADVPNRDRLCILSKYPDQSVERHRPREQDWHGSRLATRLVLSASLWTHKAPVALALALEGRREDEEMMRAMDRKELAAASLCLTLHNQLGQEDGLQIFLHPRPPR